MRWSSSSSQHGVGHLVRVLRSRRLVDLGLVLPRSPFLASRTRSPRNHLRRLDAEPAATAEQTEQAHGDNASNNLEETS